jgi:excinuclease ABC subunit A
LAMSEQGIIVRGARMHNLKNIDITIPRNQLVVVTGLSGSGKSSLAFDTVYAEGQRRYIESLSAYARQFLGQMDKPDVDSIEGLSPAISIEQRTASRNPRSTVGTSTEIYDYLRLLFARIGTPHCHKCGREIAGQTVSQMVDRILALPEGTRIIVYAPIVSGRKGEFAREFEKLMRQGFVRAKVDGEVYELSDPPKLDKKKKHDIDLMIDRVVVKASVAQRLADSLETALSRSEGIVKISVLGPEKKTSHESRVTSHDNEILLSEKHACAYCSVSLPEITPQLFSFNSPKGACNACDGLGIRRYFDPDLIVPNRHLSLREGAVVPWQKKGAMAYIELVESLAKHYRVDIYKPFGVLPEKLQNTILHGSGEEEIEFAMDVGGGRRRKYKAPFEGIIPHFERRWQETSSDSVRADVERFMNMRPCPTCDGARLRPEALFVTVGGKNIAEVCAMPIDDLLGFMKDLRFTEKQEAIGGPVIKEIRERLSFLVEVGLSYLSLDRASATLAGGEDQRIRLATQIGSALTGVLYVLDEPSIGLHQRDNHRLIGTLKRLRDLRNTVLVVEHDHDMIMSADHIIDLGPGAGVKGGHVVAIGSPEQIMEDEASLTGQFLAGRRSIEIPKRRREAKGGWLEVVGATEHNLKDISVKFPLGLITAVTGVSGSGKSTLINETLLAGLNQRIGRSRDMAGRTRDIRGWEGIQKVIDIDQAPIGRTPRSNPATYTGVFTHVRELMSQLPESRARGYKPGRFSFNVKGGRCEACEGDGIIKIEMHFLPDVYVECEVCRGKRFNRETLEVEYKGKSISDILKMTVAESHRFFENIPPIRHKLETLIDVGLDYIELGQSATTLSGGEAQRIKLSRELARRPRMLELNGVFGGTLYVLDEPTTGLHFDDVSKLLGVLDRLVKAGNTIIVIEHNLDVIKFADYCVDLGPEGGNAGGEVVATGTPEEIAANPASHTGRYLKAVL